MMDALTGWAETVNNERGANQLLHTTDGGFHWRDVTPISPSGREIAIYQVYALTSHIAWAATYEGTLADTTRIFRTVDGGLTWRNNTLAGGTINFIDAHDGWLMSGVGALGSMEVDIYHSTDGGETWTKVESTKYNDSGSGLPFGGVKAGITFLNATTGWIAGATNGLDSMLLYVTHDSGHTWREQQVPLPPQATPHWEATTEAPIFFTARDGIIPVSYSIFNNSQETGLFVVFYVTHDGGATWRYTTPVSACCSWSFADIRHGWVTDGHSLDVTTDGGRHWTRIQPSPAFADVRQLDFISSQVGWAVSRMSPFLLKTQDGGHMWTPMAYTVSR